MATFSPTEAAFEGFRIIRREPMTVVAWGVASAVVGLVSIGLMLGLGFPRMMQEMAIQPGSGTLPNFGPLIGIGLLSIPIALIIYAVIICAVYRAVLRPSETGFARLRLGADELRMALLMLILWLLYFAIMIVIVIVAAIAAIVLGAGAMSGGEASGAAMAAVVGLVGLIYLLLAFSGAFFGTQFSMAGPMTFDKGELYVFRSWKLLKGNYWRVFGCYALIAIITVILYFVLMLVQMAVSAAVGAPSPFTAAMNPAAAQDFGAVFSPAAIAVSLFSSFVGTAFYALWFAPGAAAYRDLAGRSATGAADVFN